MLVNCKMTLRKLGILQCLVLTLITMSLIAQHLIKTHRITLALKDPNQIKWVNKLRETSAIFLMTETNVIT